MPPLPIVPHLDELEQVAPGRPLVVPVEHLAQLDLQGREETLPARGPDSYVSLEERVPSDHPLRAIRALVEPVLVEVAPRWAGLYAETGRPSIPPEQLLRALLLQVLQTIRSERQLMEQLDYNLLYRWFVSPSEGGITYLHFSAAC